MGFYDLINTVIGPVLGPLKILGPFYVILLISFLVSLIITFVYKWTTDQELMKSLKEEIKRLQQEMKKLRDKPEKMMKAQKEAMDKNMKYMIHSFKATFITFIPLILIFGWLNTNFAYESIGPGEEFSTYMFFEDNSQETAVVNVPENVTLISEKQAETKTILKKDQDELPFRNQYLMSKRYGGFLDKDKNIYYAGWNLSAEKEGRYSLEYAAGNFTYYKEVLISFTDYEKPIEKIDDGVVKGIMVDQGKLIVMNLLGWKLGWLGAYIILSIVFSTILRKVLKVY